MELSRNQRNSLIWFILLPVMVFVNPFAVSVGFSSIDKPVSFFEIYLRIVSVYSVVLAVRYVIWKKATTLPGYIFIETTVKSQLHYFLFVPLSLFQNFEFFYNPIASYTGNSSLGGSIFLLFIWYPVSIMLTVISIALFQHLTTKKRDAFKLNSQPFLYSDRIARLRNGLLVLSFVVTPLIFNQVYVHVYSETIIMPADAVRIGESDYFRKDNDLYVVCGSESMFFCVPQKVILNQSSTFETIGRSYARDSIQGYYLEKAFVADVNTLEVIGAEYIPPEIGRARKIGSEYARDVKHVFYRGEVIESSDPGTFILLDKGFAKDNRHVYHNGRIASEHEPIDFDETTITQGVMNSHISADADDYEVREDGVYFQNQTLTGAATTTFAVASSSTFHRIHVTYAYDDNDVWMNGKKIHGADPKSFTVLDGPYSKDNNKVFYAGRKIDADPFSVRTLSIIKGLDTTTFLLDKNGVYCYGELSDYTLAITKVPGADPETFEIISSHFAKDSDTVYQNNCGYYYSHVEPPEVRIISGADPDTFEVLRDGTPKDKNTTYKFYNGWIVQ